MSYGNEQFEQDERLPEKLGEDLARLYGRQTRVPGEMDRKILSMGRARMAGVGRNRLRLWVQWGGAVAAAALVVIAVRLAIMNRETPQAVTVREKVVTPDDVKKGKVDILDAYLLARRVKLGEQLSQQWDFNNDGKVDQGDVNTIAQAAVSLRGGEVQ
jgi:hypothetical protein